MLKDGYGYPIPLFGLGATTVVAISGTAGRLTLGSPKFYRIISSVDCFIKQGGSAVDATTNDAPLTAKADLGISTISGSEYISGITTGTSGNLYATELII
jgi:hypothetical protein